MKTKTPRGKSVKKRTKKPSVKPLKNIPLDYTASIKILGKKYQATGSTAGEAIENLKVGKVAKGMSILELSRDGSSHSKILPHMQTIRLFSPSKLMRSIALKNVSLMFSGF